MEKLSGNTRGKLLLVDDVYTCAVYQLLLNIKRVISFSFRFNSKKTFFISKRKKKATGFV